MESRQVSMIINDLEQKLRTIQNNRIHDDATLNQLESLINQCAHQIERLQNSSDPIFVPQILPSLLQIVISLMKICSEKSEFVQFGINFSREKLQSPMNLTKTLYNQMKEYIKSPKLNSLLSKSSEQRSFCHQLRRVSDSIGQSDLLATLICQKLIVKLLTGSAEDQSTQSNFTRMDEINDGLPISIYRSVLQQMATICSKTTRESQTIKMYNIYFQMLLRLIQYSQTINEIDDLRNFFQLLIQLHQCLEKTCEQNRFQIEFFTNTIALQDVLKEFVEHSLKSESNLFFDNLFAEICSNPSKYGSLIVVFRLIEAFDVTMTKRTSNDICLHWIDRLLRSLFNLIDQCQIQLVVPAVIPTSFSKSQVEYGSLYDIGSSQLMKLLGHQPMQTLICSMTFFLETTKTCSILSSSIQMISELIIQSCYLYENNSEQFEKILSLFLVELLRSDRHQTFVQHLLTLINKKSIRARVYQMFLMNDHFHDVFQLFSSTNIETKLKKNFVSPTRIDHFYGFARIYQNNLTCQQIQQGFDICLFVLNQFVSLQILNESNCQEFLVALRLLSLLRFANNFDGLKSLLGQLTQIFVLLDDRTAFDIRIELIRLFSNQINNLDDQDLGRLFDFILTSSFEPDPSSIGFHLMCLELVDAVRQRSTRTAQINDLIIQLIVRYGNESSSSLLFKTHLMRIFRNYISNGNDNSLVMRVKSQCALLRSNIDEFEKSVKTSANSITWQDFPAQPNETNEKNVYQTDEMLKFYRTLVNECQLECCSSSEEAMQED